MSKQLYTTSKLASVVLASMMATACSTMVAPGQQAERMNYRSDRYADMLTLDDYAQCQNQGFDLDQQAQSAPDIATYLASARQLAKCDALIADQRHLVDTKTQMHSRAISIVNFIKGGDVAQARVAFEAFQRDFNGKDLTFQDGTSFSQSVSLLIYPTEAGNDFRLATANARPDLKGELRRMTYWGAY